MKATLQEAEKHLRDSARIFRKYAASLDVRPPRQTEQEKTEIDEQVRCLTVVADRHEATANKLAELTQQED